MSESRIGVTARQLYAKLASSLAGPFERFLPKAWVDEALEGEKHVFRRSAFPPWVVLWAWIGQALDGDPSCNKALARINAHRARLGLSALSTDTGGYCKARRRLPEGLFCRLSRRIGQSLHERARPHDLWHGRVVKVVDGSSSSMPDTPANQRAYPQPSTQRRGCGFPVVGFVGVFCLATGAALDIVLGTWMLHELTLFYSLRRAFAAGEIMLADRAYCSYAELALMHQRGVDVVARLHQRRRTDFRRGRVVGWLDHVVTWTKPAQRPRGLRREDYHALPATLVLRELRFRVEPKGFRPQTITLATTLLDAPAYPAEDLADLYARRWDIEVNFRHIKTTLRMEVLRGKSPDIVRKEIHVHLLAYNLIRSTIWEAAARHGLTPDRISFKGAIQHVTAHADLFAHYRRSDRPRRRGAFSQLVHLVARRIIPHRPGRVEPRVRKRRPKPYPLMTRPRSQLKAELGT